MSYESTILAEVPPPTGYWILGESSGTTAFDSSGNGYNATLPASGITYSQIGAIVGDTHTSMLFTSSATLSLPYTLNPSLWTALSLEFWINLTSGWQYVVVTTSNTGSTILYLNGAVYSVTTGDFIGIDTDIYYAGSPVSGDLNQVALYNYVLTPIQILRHFLQRISSGGFALFGSGTGTASFDHFRVTQYPDPSLSLSPIAPRVGSTLVNWNALTPTNTTLGIDISTDGVNWTDVTSNNGGNLPGIFSQPIPTTDGFATNTSANYTSTFRTGGSALTTTFDTAKSRLVLTNGTNGIYLNSSINRADIDFFADLDQSDAGGLVFRFNDAGDFYYVLIGDSLASTGTKNQITLYKVVANVQTQLATAAISYSIGTPSTSYTVTFTRGTFRRFRVTMLSGVITAYVDGIQLLTYTDGSPLGAGQVGLFNNGGTSRYYQLWIVQVGDYVSGTPQYDIVTGKFIYTRQRLATTSPTVTPQVEDITTLATTPEIGIGGVIPSVAYNASQVSTNSDDLVKASGNYTWFIDQNKHYNFIESGTVAAPWILQSAPAGLVMNVDLEVNTDLELDSGNDLYRNRQIILGAQAPTSTQVLTFSGDGNTTTFTLGYPLSVAPLSIVLNGITQTIGLKGTTGSAYYYALNDAVLQQDTSQTVLQATDQLVVTYIGLFAITVQVDDTTEQAARAIIEGGSGIVENTEDHTTDNPPMLEAQAVAYAQSLINRYAIAGRTLIFSTSRNGLALGQTLTIMLPEHAIWNGQFLITQIEIKLAKDVQDSQIWWYKVTSSELPRQASWAKLLASGLGLQ